MEIEYGIVNLGVKFDVLMDVSVGLILLNPSTYTYDGLIVSFVDVSLADYGHYM